MSYRAKIFLAIAVIFYFSSCSANGDYGNIGGHEFNLGIQNDFYNPALGGDEDYKASAFHHVGLSIPELIQIPMPQPLPQQIYVPQPVAVPIYKLVPQEIEKKVPLVIEKPVPYPVEKPYKIEIEKHHPVPVSKPYPVYVPVYKHVYHHTSRSKGKWH